MNTIDFEATAVPFFDNNRGWYDEFGLPLSYPYRDDEFDTNEDYPPGRAFNDLVIRSLGMISNSYGWASNRAWRIYSEAWAENEARSAVTSTLVINASPYFDFDEADISAVENLLGLDFEDEDADSDKLWGTIHAVAEGGTIIVDGTLLVVRFPKEVA